MWFFSGLAINVIFWEIILRNIGLRALTNRTAEGRYNGAARRYRTLAVRLGGVLIKVGQFLSSRVDVLPEYVTSELSGLQDEVTAEKFDAIQAVIAAEMNGPLERFFKHFERAPLAAASLGQVHRAILFSGEKVVVKTLRPGIEQIVEIDLAALRTVVSWLKHYKLFAERADVEKILVEFSATLKEELDYSLEASNARRFAEMFRNDPGVRIPCIYDELCTRRVLVMEDVMFIKITDYEAITTAGVSRADVAERLLETYFYQIFTENFFHADPHPGNLFVEPPAADKGWRLVFVDFGMVGRVTPEIRAAGREAVVALATRDAQRLARSSVMGGVLLPGADIDRLTEAYTALLDRFWGKSMDELRKSAPREIHRFKKEFRDLLYNMPFQVPENMIYLGRCLAILSGMCTGLNPDFNLFASLIPLGESMLEEEIKEGGWEYWLNQLLDQARKMFAIPARLDSAIARLERGELTVITQPPKEQIQQLRQLIKALNRLAIGVVFSVLIVTGAWLYIEGYPLYGYIGWGIGLVALLMMLIKR